MDNQLALFEMDPHPAPIVPLGFYTGRPRPGHASKEVLIAVASKLLPQVMDWGSFTDDDESEVAEQLLRTLEFVGEDAYRLTKYLEDTFHWSADTELTDIMDCADFYCCHKRAVQAWIKDNDAKPALPIGHEVKVRLFREPECTGVIRDITDDGMYCVRIPSKGHVEVGQGTQGTLLTWEDVEAWQS